MPSVRKKKVKQKNKIGWISLKDNGDPGWRGSDQHYLVVLNDRFITVSFFFCDSFGHWWSSQWDLYDKEYSIDKNDTFVTHYAEMVNLPDKEEDK